MKKLLLSIVLAVAVANVSAISYTWNGGSSTWNTITNWTPNGTPGTGDDVTINSATPITITLGNATLVNTLSVSGSSTISFAGAFTFTVNSGLTFSGGTKISLTATQDFMLGNGNSFILSGMDATNYFTANPTGGTVGGLRFNTTTTTNNLYVDPAVTFYNFTCSKGTMTLCSNLKTARLGFSSGSNNPTLKLNTDVTLNITGNSTSTFNTTGFIDASASESKVSITSTHTSILTASRQIFTGTINNFEINTSGTYVPYSALNVNNLTLTAGSINNATNNITINNNGTITRTSGTVSNALIYGESTSDRINITYNGNVSPGTEATTGVLGTIGTFTVNDTKTLTLNAGSTLYADYIVVGNGTSGVLTYPDSSTPTTLTVNKDITVNTGGTFKCGTQANAVTHLLNVGGTITNDGNFTTVTASGKIVDVTLNGTNAQSINSPITFYGLTIANTTNTVSAGAALNTTNLTINSGAILNMQSNALSTVTTTNGTGKLQTQATTAAVPSGKIWSFNVEYNNATGGQSVTAGTYTGGLTISNTSGVNTASSHLTIGDILTLNSDSKLNIPSGIYIYSGTGFTGSTGGGTLQIGDINTVYHIPSGLTWGGTVQYAFAGNNRIVPGYYNNLIIDDGTPRSINWGNADGETGTIAIAGTLTTSSTSFDPNQVTLEFNGTNQVIPRINVYNLKLSGSGTTFPATYLYIANNFDPGSIASANQGTIIFNGTSSQTIPSFGYNIINISNTAGATLNSNLTVPSLTINASGILNISAGKQLTVSTSMTNNGTLNLLSTSGGGTATILTPASISGTNAANVEQYLASSRNWYMSSPVTGATASAGPTYYKYVEALNNGTTWTPVNSGDTYALMTGYIVKPTTSTTYNFSGTLNTGNKTISGLTSTATAKTGFNLVGNPYPSYVKWSEAVKTNLDETMWYRTHDGSAYKFYTYHPVDGEGGIGVPATVTDYIPPLQAFWVKVNTGQTGSLQFLNTSRDHKDEAGSVFRAPKATNSAMKLLRLQVSNTIENDETVLYFNANASDNLDSYDSPKMFNYNAAIPEIYTTAGVEKLVINGMSEVKYDTEIPLGFVNGQTNETNSFSIKATELKNFEAGTRVILRDKVDVVDYELNGDNAYTFTSDAINSTSRFSLLFKSPSVTTNIANAKNSSMYAFVDANNNIVIAGSEKATYSIYNSVGMLIENGKTTAKLQTVNCKLQTGVYVVKVGNQTTKVIIK